MIFLPQVIILSESHTGPSLVQNDFRLIVLTSHIIKIMVLAHLRALVCWSHHAFQPHIGVDDVNIHLPPRTYSTEQTSSGVQIRFFDFSSNLNSSRENGGHADGAPLRLL